MLPVDVSKQQISGLIISKHCTVDAASKLKAEKLYGWKSVALTPEQWIQALESGSTIQPSQFNQKLDEDGNVIEPFQYTHAEEYWQSTHFVCADADYIRGVDFTEKLLRDPDGKPIKDEQGKPIPVLDDNGEPVMEDVNPDGVVAWQEDKQLCRLYPSLADDCYAALQSVSSMTDVKPPPHRRYRLIFVFDEKIESVDHYSQILLTLSERYPIIPSIKRAPSQPVFGNANDTGKAVVTGNVLSLSDFAYTEPVASDKPSSNGKTPTGKYNATQRRYCNDLDGLITDAKLTRHETGPDGTVRVDCPFNPKHTRDACIGLNAGGYPYFKCHHNSCSGHGFNQMVKSAGIEVVSENKSGAKVGSAQSEKPEPIEIAEEFMDKHRYWFTHEELHQYNPHTGLYEPCEPILRYDARKVLGRKARTQTVNEVQNHITDMAHRSDYGDDGAVFKNGVLSFDSMNLSSHSPDRYYLSAYPVNYICSKEVDERPFTDYLNELVMDMDGVVTLLEMIGSCFYSEVHDLQTGFMLTGSGSNGKSTLLEIIDSLIGLENISRTPFPDYGVNRWAKADLVGKSVALDDDIDLSVPLSSAIKPLITQKYHQGEEKYKKSFMFKMMATFIGAINGQPNTLDTTNAFWRRWCILDFPNVFDKDAGRKREIMDTFTDPDMLDDIASISLHAFSKARRVGRFNVPSHSAELIESFQEDTNHVITFGNECLAHEPEAYESRKAIWGAYNDWATANRIQKPYGNQRFWSALANMNYKTTRKVRIGDTLERIVDDVKLV